MRVTLQTVQGPGRAAWRPLGEQHAERLAEALSRSKLPAVLGGLAVPGAGGRLFERQGHNHSGVIRLQWQALPPAGRGRRPVPGEALLTAEVPGGYGRQATHLHVHLDVTTRLAAWDAAQEAEWQPVNSVPQPAEPCLMSFEALGLMMDAMIAALVDE